MIPSRMWMHGVMVGGYIAGWSTIVIVADGYERWAPYASALLLAFVISLTMRYLEVQRTRMLQQLQLVDDRRREKLRHEALHDPLTGMPNRALFRQQLREVFERAKSSEERFAVLSIDLNRFKLVNESLGRRFGDRLLKAVATRLGRFVRRVDVPLLSRAAGPREDGLSPIRVPKA